MLVNTITFVKYFVMKIHGNCYWLSVGRELAFVINKTLSISRLAAKFLVQDLISFRPYYNLQNKKYCHYASNVVINCSSTRYCGHSAVLSRSHDVYNIMF